MGMQRVFVGIDLLNVNNITTCFCVPLLIADVTFALAPSTTSFVIRHPVTT